VALTWHKKRTSKC